MEHGAIDYLSFVRGFTAALDAQEADLPGDSPDTVAAQSGVDPDSYARGFEAGSQLVPQTLIYRELSIQDGGRFTGTLDLPDDESSTDIPEIDDGGPWHEPLGQSRTETAPSTHHPEPPFDEPVQLSGTLELG
ncbi:hypothetical protein [Saccharomonospora viridis]|jgi:hypothetical protein|uniref:Uncharacterized protein n=2 Tax=Saccharomonospora viridis TaxID=1852 RepID=C7MRK9_SACVD|nr:hypothetical protein [Saccharomonospora viridis]ACU98795.1 hypothetical protein Svir_38510 [Saccharomonospora viridis DSM 43017]KHF44589.1 hypothetical protein MINT15_14710 [Saccharomonospora viridis]SFP25226.1 hypothetical protein SAMN02982918_1859 [Saccharomonospora viridis]